MEPLVYLDIPGEFKRPYEGPLPRHGEWIRVDDDKPYGYRQVIHISYLPDSRVTDDTYRVAFINVLLSDRVTTSR